MKVGMSLYRAALWLLPPGFRRAYGTRLREAAESRLAEGGGAGARLVVALRLAADLGWAVAREWWDTVDQGVRHGMGGGMSIDLRQALRALVRAPGFSAAVIATLGLGIGVTTVAFGLVETCLLRALPFPEGERLVAAWPAENWSRQMMDEAKEGTPSFEGIAGAGGAMLVLQEGGEPEEVFASLSTTNLHDVLGVKPALGRAFVREDGRPGAEPVTLLAHDLWVERFGADPDILGRSIALGGEGRQRRTVVGVMPEGYLPLQGKGVDVWIPVAVDPADDAYAGSYFMEAVGRLRPGVRPRDATRDLRALGERMARVQPGWFSDERVARASAVPLALQRSSDRRTPVLVALGAALLVLLVACANVANLLVARTAGRERELSVRAALGAGRTRTARVVLAEVAVLAAAGAGLGWVVAVGLRASLQRWLPSALPDWGMDIDPRWVAVTLGLALLSTLAAGLVPAMRAARHDPARALAGGRGARGGRRSARVQELLSAAQIAVATAGVAGMGLLGRSLLELARVDPGFATSGAVAFRVTAPPAAYPDDADVVRFFREARRALAEVGGVEAVGFASRLPLDGGDSRTTVTPEDWTFSETDTHPVAWHRLVTPGYLEAMGARLVSGRFPTPRDDEDGSPELVVINRAAADAFWPDADPLGKRFYGPGHEVWLTVVGVVDDLRENGQARDVLPGLYIPHRDWPWRTMYAVVRAGRDPAGMMPELKRAVWAVSAGAPISRVTSLEQVARQGLRPARTLATLAGVTAIVTLLLGALGVYGVVSHAVGRRTRELGVRAALGAGRARLLRGELGGATRIVVQGIAVGLVLAWILGRTLRGALFGVGPLDLPSLAGAVSILAAVAYLAAWLPARRACAVDPVRVMREE